MRPSATTTVSVAHFLERADEEVAAGRDLGRRRLVLGRHAAHCIADPAIDQFEAVVGACGIGAAGEAEIDQRRVEQVAGIVAGERPAGAVGAAQPGRQAEHEKTRVGRAK